MFVYEYKAKLKYEYYDGSQFKRDTSYIFDPFKYQNDTEIEIVIKEGFELDIANIKANSDEESFLYVCEEIEKLCKVLTILLQFQNYDNRENSPNLTYIPSEVKYINRKELSNPQYKDNNGVLHIKDSIHMRDGIASMRCTQEFDFLKFDCVFSALNKNEFECELSDTIYRAVLSRSLDGRYFHLFSIIEMIETKFIDDDEINNKIFDESMSEEIKNIMLKYFDTKDIDKEHKSRINSRFMQIVKSATVETRAEKLTNILIKSYKITNVEKGMIRYEVNEEKMKCFIKYRNNLFHGKKITKTNVSDFLKATNELQELCLQILQYGLNNK